MKAEPIGWPQLFPAPAGPSAGVPHRYRTHLARDRAAQDWARIWGLDSHSGKWVDARTVVRVSLRGRDADQAKTLFEACDQSCLIDPIPDVRLEPPTLESVAVVCQRAALCVGQSSKLASRNPGRHVKSGLRSV